MTLEVQRMEDLIKLYFNMKSLLRDWQSGRIERVEFEIKLEEYIEHIKKIV